MTLFKHFFYLNDAFSNNDRLKALGQWTLKSYSILSLVHCCPHIPPMDPAAEFMQATGTTDANKAAAMLASADGDVQVRTCVLLDDCHLLALYCVLQS